MTANEAFTAVGAFKDRAQADAAVRELSKAGFALEQIGVAAPRPEPSAVEQKVETQADKGAASGAAAGAAVGAMTGAAMTGLIPGIGPIVAAGLMTGILGGTALGAAAGSLIGALVGLGFPDEDANYYDREFAAGRVIVAVKAAGRSAEAAELLRRCGAHKASASPEPATLPPTSP